MTMFAGASMDTSLFPPRGGQPKVEPPLGSYDGLRIRLSKEVPG